MPDTARISTPCIRVTIDNLIVPFDSPEEVYRSVRSAVRRNYFRDAKYFDVSGYLYEVSDVEIVGGIGPLWGYWPIFDRVVQIELNLKREPYIASVDEFSLVIQKCMNDPDAENLKYLPGLKSYPGRIQKCRTSGEAVALLLKLLSPP